MNEKGKKILILSASPQRDKPVDDLLAEELRKMGNEVWVKACLREGRSSVLELKPDVVVLPPIRNPHSRDLAETLKSWGVGVASRHTEASADWQDFKKMDGFEKSTILGRWSYLIDLELVWGNDEAEILRRRGCPFPVIAVGSFSADAYKTPNMLSRYAPKKVFCAKHKLDPKKKTVLILSAWGFMDSAPDLRIDEHDKYLADQEGLKKWLEMIKIVHAKLKNKFNILVSLHPGVLKDPYTKALDASLGIPIDTESTAVELVLNCDVVIHAGSTTAMGAHFLSKPAFQYGDQNQSGTWFDRAESMLSHISPYAKTPSQLVNLIKKCKFGKTNADSKAIENLEKGRYGKMDGQAYKRAAELINKIRGKFKMCWPKAHRDYDQPLAVKNAERILQRRLCGICKNPFFVVTPMWLKLVSENLQLTPHQTSILPRMKMESCPHCAAKYYDNWNNNPGSPEQPTAAVQGGTAIA